MIGTTPAQHSQSWLDELEARAAETLPRSVYDWIAGGSGDETSLRLNVEAWRSLLMRPRSMVDVESIHMATQLLGQDVSHPIAVAPTGFHGLSHEAAEIASASGSAGEGGLFVLSSRSSLKIEDIAPHCGLWWYQPYILKDRDQTAQMAIRASQAGAKAMVLTVDSPVLAKRRRSRDPSLVSPEVLQINTGRVEDLKLLEQSPNVTADDITWLAELTGLPVVVKGVLRPDMARKAVDRGAAAVWISNHGGRQLDGAIPTARALAQMAHEMPDTEFYVDGGISSGSDVARALALGARAVFVGRAVLWGLALDGERGVSAVISRMRDELHTAMQLLGTPSVGDFEADLIERHP